MGYFKRKLDRGRARKVVRDLNERVDGDGPWESIPDSPPERAVFLRFSIPERHSNSGQRTGIFQAAYRAKENEAHPLELRRRLGVVLDWFEDWLWAPRRLDEERAIFFFKSTARTCIGKIWELLHLLREADIWAEMQMLENPGRILYEDSEQIAALPLRDTTGL